MGTRRYLTLDEAGSALRQGRPVEQWLGLMPRSPGRVVRWLRIEQAAHDGFSVCLYEPFDVDGFESSDIYELLEEPDAAVSEAFDSEGAAIRYAIDSLRASPDRFVNAGLVQDE